MENNKIYWKGIEELTNDVDFVKNAHKEFPDYLPVSEQSGKQEEGSGTNRRDFLKLMGFGVAAVSLAACEAPVKKAIPYLNKPEEIEASIANYYASTYAQDGEYCSILVKTREGRPIKIEGNELSKVTQGGSSARVLASILSLYDLSRIQDGAKKGLAKKANISFEDADKEIIAALQASSQTVYLVTGSILSPTAKKLIGEFTSKYPNVKHISYDAVSAYGILKANEQSFGINALPVYDFSKAETIVSVGADFLGTWLSSIEYAKQYAKTRRLGKGKNDMSRHYQFESGMSLSGANADYRVQIRPSQEGLVIAHLYNKVVGGSLNVAAISNEKIAKKVEEAAKDLTAKRGKALLVAGSNDPSVQILVNAINHHLGSYESTINLDTPSYLKQGNDEEMLKFVEAAKNGSIGGAIFYGVNPVYDFPKGKELGEALKNISLSVSLSDKIDETSALCNYILPSNHFLESWGDAEPRKGSFSLMQPTITNIFKTRQAEESLLSWTGNKSSYYDYLRSYWRNNILKGDDFEKMWVETLHDGVYENSAVVAVAKENEKEKVTAGGGGIDFQGDVNAASSNIAANYQDDNKTIELVTYQKVAIGSGALANNPWLQELPDPITKATWDNYLAVSIAYANKEGLKQGDVVKVSANGYSVEVPVLVQPGQAAGTVSLALGYGRSQAGKVGNGVGVDAYPFLAIKNGTLQYSSADVKIAKTDKNIPIAQTQTHQTIMGRDIVQEAKLSEYQKAPNAGRVYHSIMTAEGPKKPTEITMWKGHQKAYDRNHWWGMVIDLNACNGCSACLIGCQSENNVPVVGKQEVLNRREMHWLRIDRYYSSVVPKEKEKEYKTLSGYSEMEKASEEPEVVFQPMMCQHCNNAPCETVCPVLATTHSSEGLNQMTYNRCIGTRYCANNCPYKVRRFNWFNYTNDKNFEDVNYLPFTDLGKMVINPDVTVRSRGVMEKCSLCVQRIQEGKLKARKEKRKLQDGEVKTACQTACPADAIVFGDMNDPESQIAQVLEISKNEETGDVVFAEPRSFHVLEEINVRPNISYLTKIRNKA